MLSEIRYYLVQPKRIDKYRVELNQKKCNPAILFYCFYTTGVLYTFVLNNRPGISFYRKNVLEII